MAAEFCEALTSEQIVAPFDVFQGEPDFQGCQAADMQGVRFVCRWKFGHRSLSSRRAFDRLIFQLKRCPRLTGSTRDAAVNHPDFYDAWEFRFEGFKAAVSLKDKSALGATFVVLRVSEFP